MSQPPLVLSVYWDARVDEVAPLSLRSLLKQSRRIERIVVGCAPGCAPDAALRRRAERVEWHDTESASAADWLLETMRQYPQSPMATAGLNHRYPRDWFRFLHESWRQTPQHIQCYAARYLLVDDEGRVSPSRLWPRDRNVGASLLSVRAMSGPNRNLQALPRAGVIYPGGAFCDVKFPAALRSAKLSDAARLGLMGLYAGLQTKRRHSLNRWPDLLAANEKKDDDQVALQRAYDACQKKNPAAAYEFKDELKRHNEARPDAALPQAPPSRPDHMLIRVCRALRRYALIFSDLLRIALRGFSYPQTEFGPEAPASSDMERWVWLSLYARWRRLLPMPAPPVIKNDPMQIISFASIPSRMNAASVCAHSLLRQSLGPDKVILWLPDDIDDIPTDLLRLRKHGLDIRLTPEIGPYKKLVPALKAYPDALIATADDDRIYPRRWFEGLREAYRAQPQFLHCCSAKRMHRIEDERLAPYAQWSVPQETPDDPLLFTEPSLDLLPMSGAGVLFARGLLHAEALNEEVFLNICPYADDIWYKATSLMNDVPVKKLQYANIMPIVALDSQQDALHISNLAGGGNDWQIDNVFKRYGLFERVSSSPPPPPPPPVGARRATRAEGKKGVRRNQRANGLGSNV